MVAGHERVVSRLGERVANEAKRLRVVVHDQDARPLVSAREGQDRQAARGSGRAVAGLLHDGDREGKARALARTCALGEDAPAMRLHQPLADSEPKTAADAALSVVDTDARVLAKQVRKVLGRDAPALVEDRDRDVHPVADRLDADGRGCGCMSRGVVEEVVQHLNDAPPVGHHRGKVGRQVDEHVVAGAAGKETIPRAVHQRGDLRWLGRHREGARIDAPGIEEGR